MLVHMTLGVFTCEKLALLTVEKRTINPLFISEIWREMSPHELSQCQKDLQLTSWPLTFVLNFDKFEGPFESSTRSLIRECVLLCCIHFHGPLKYSTISSNEIPHYMQSY